MRWPWQRVGPAAWEPGPDSVDWDFDLDRGCFGPLYPGAPLARIHEALGRPDRTGSSGESSWLFYARFDLSICLTDGRIDELNLGWDPPEPPEFDGRIRLRTVDRRLTTLSPTDVIEDYGEPDQSDGDPALSHTLWWTLDHHSICLDIAADGLTIETVGITVIDRE